MLANININSSDVIDCAMDLHKRIRLT
uniref:Uncharacterized protein n=1 Tax=Anguilla anguilla TaxID=7936 RepID=A0A0E9V2K4_ANGAN